LLSSAEATVLMQRAVQTHEAGALEKAETIMRTIATDAGAAAAVRSNPALNEVVTTMRDAQATVARSGLQLSESAKKDFLQARTKRLPSPQSTRTNGPRIQRRPITSLRWRRPKRGTSSFPTARSSRFPSRSG